MADVYSIPAADALSMFGDAHSTNWAENYQFFMNQNNPTNFERVWQQAYYLYRQIGSITHQPVPFDQVMDFSVIEKLGKEEKYSSQKDEYVVKILPKSVTQLRAESEILTNTVVIHFYPNQDDPYFKVSRQEGDQTIEELYDPSVDLVLDEVAGLVARFGGAQIVIEGHTDSSMRGTVPETLVKDLSSRRANAVRTALLKKFPNFRSAAVFFSRIRLGRARPTRMIPTIRPRTAAWRSRSTRPKNSHERSCRMNSAGPDVRTKWRERPIAVCASPRNLALHRLALRSCLHRCVVC